MKVVTFYSFKGGVGRSNLLYNVAYILAARHGARVVIADFDLHAPGLTCLQDLEAPDGGGVSPGIVDILSDLASPVGDEVLDPSGSIRRTRIGQRLQEAGSRGQIWFLPAGAFTGDASEAYRKKVQDLRAELPRLVASGARDLLSWFVDGLGARFEAEGAGLDYLFLDARTGLTELGELLMSRIPDHQVVLVFGLNDQNVQGMEHVLRWLIGETGPANLPSRLVLVASPVPIGEDELKRQRRRKADSVVRAVIEEASRAAGVHPAMPPFRTIPYHPLVALTEGPISEPYPDSEIAKAFGEVADLVRLSPLALERVQQQSSLRIRERTGEERDKRSRGRSAREDVAPAAEWVEHPLARLLAWNVLRPEATPAMILGRGGASESADELLTYLANSISLGYDQCKDILDSYAALSQKQAEALVAALREEHELARQLSEQHWPRMAAACVAQWVRWAVLTAPFFKVDLKEAVRRVFQASPITLEGDTGGGIALGAARELIEDPILRYEQPGVADAFQYFLDMAADRNPGNVGILVGVGRIYVEQSNLEMGDAYFRRAIELRPNDANLHIAWGDAKTSREGRFGSPKPYLNAAILHYRQAIEIDPSRHDAEFKLGNVLVTYSTNYAHGDEAVTLLGEAHGYLRRSVEMELNNYETERAYGRCCTGLAHALRVAPDKALTYAEEGVQHLRKAIAIRPDADEAYTDLGNALDEHIQDLVMLKRVTAGTLALVAEAEMYSGYTEKRKNDGRGRSRGTALSSRRTVLLLWKNHVLKALGRDAEAWAATDEALQILRETDNESPSYNLACVLAQRGEHEGALSTLETSDAREAGDLDWILVDPDLDPLRGLPRFEAWIASLRARVPASKTEKA